MKKILIFLSILFITPIVFADDYNVSSSITAPTCSGSSCTGGRYTGLENYNVGANNVYAINTRYNGRLGAIRFNIPLPSALDNQCYPTGDLSYRLTLNMATEDWRNKFSRPFISSSSSGSNWATSNVVFVSMKKIYFDFKIPNSYNCYDFLYVYLQSTSQSSVSFTGVNNWNLSNITLTANFPVNPTPTATATPRPTATPKPDSSNTDIINANNQNTQSIINNNNQNTQSIIDNNDDNTQSIINNNNENTANLIENNNQNTHNFITNDLLNGVNNERNNFDILSNDCGEQYIYDLDIGKSFYSTGSEYDREGYFYTPQFIPLNGATKLSFEGFNGPNSSDTGILILYDSNYNRIDHWSMGNRFVDISSNAVYFKYATKFPIGRIFKDKVCKSKQDITNEKLDELNSSINNGNIDNKTGFFSDFQDNTHGLTDIITLPLSTIQSLTNNSCIPLNVPIPFTNSNVSLPCMTQVYENYIPSVYSVWQVVSFGIISYFICLDIFKMVKGFKDPNEDKIEVLDL